jgi:hypothetical protein
VNGFTTNDLYDGYMFSKIFSSSDMVTPLDISNLDDENIKDYQSSHLFTWTDTFTGRINDDDSLIIELWLNVTGGGGTKFEQTTNPTFNADSTGWTPFSWSDETCNDEIWEPTGGVLNSGWLKIVVQIEPCASVSFSRGGYWEQVFTPTGTPTISTANLDFDWCCQYNEKPNDVTFSLFIDTESGWPVVGTEVWKETVSVTTPWESVIQDVSSVVDSATIYYLKMAIWVDNITKFTDVDAGYDNICLTWETTESNFITEFDYSTTKSSVNPSIESILDVNLSIAGVDDWTFVSFPITATGDVLTIFDDGAWGDSGTTWDYIQWYDPTDALDHWKTYSVYKPPALNDLPIVNNTMGFWMHITANGGDQLLTCGTGDHPVAVTAIQLYAGWNLVGYPSSAQILASDTLPGAVTRMAVYDGGQPYCVLDIAQAQFDTVTMSEGEAYWIFADADTIWNVAP